MARAERGPGSKAPSGEGGLHVTVTCVPRRSADGAKAGGLASWLARTAPRAARGTVTVAIVSDARVRALNRRYRRKDYATDVLSFPAVRAGRKGRTVRMGRNGFPLQPFQPVSPVLPFLGDIVIARGVARRQAHEAGHSPAAELRILALHGLLHLLGYDHERDDGRMRMVEQRLLRRAGVRHGLISRTAR